MKSTALEEIRYGNISETRIDYDREISLINEIDSLKREIQKKDARIRQLENGNLYDTKTGCWNGEYVDILRKNINKYIKYLKNEDEEKILGYLDFDNLKKINDQHGHRAGDKRIIDTFKNIREGLRVSDEIIRIHKTGDEGVVVLTIPREDIGDNSLTEEELVDMFRERFPDVSFGFAFVDDSAENFDQLLRVAEEKMFKNKKDHRQQQKTQNK